MFETHISVLLGCSSDVWNSHIGVVGVALADKWALGAVQVTPAARSFAENAKNVFLTHQECTIEKDPSRIRSRASIQILKHLQRGPSHPGGHVHLPSTGSQLKFYFTNSVNFHFFFARGRSLNYFSQNVLNFSRNPKTPAREIERFVLSWLKSLKFAHPPQMVHI